ncbi:cobalamin biosynthesis protein, partial [Streptomyces sp. SID10692]|nr:cobalamin biosynthesis protein [Streptomyces sp. SID10692]
MNGASAGPGPSSGARSLVVGVGARRGVPDEVVFALIEAALSAAGLDPADVAEVATVDAKGDEPGIVGAAARLGVPVRTHPAGALAAVRVPHPS